MRGVGVVLGISAAVLYSLKAIFVKLAYLPGEGLAEQVPPITLMMLRLGFSFPSLSGYPVLGVEHGGSQTDRTSTYAVWPCWQGCWLTISAHGSIFRGCNISRRSSSGLLLFTYPAFVILFGALFFGGRLTAFGAWPLMAVAYSGFGRGFYRGRHHRKLEPFAG